MRPSEALPDFGYRPVTIYFLGGVAIEVMARYWCRSQAASEKGKGSYFGLMLLGVYDRCTPALASEIAQLAAALSSFEDAQARLRQMGVEMSIRQITNIAYHFAQRARKRQELDGMGIEGSLALLVEAMQRRVCCGKAGGDFDRRRQSAHPEEQAREEDQEGAVAVSHRLA